MEARGEETGQPRRLVVTVQFRAAERFWWRGGGETRGSGSDSDCDSDCYSYHVWQFEVDVVGNDRQWRVRNINEVLKPAKGTVCWDTRYDDGQ